MARWLSMGAFNVVGKNIYTIVFVMTVCSSVLFPVHSTYIKVKYRYSG